MGNLRLKISNITFLRRGIDHIVNFAFPNACASCGKKIDPESLLCSDCYTELFEIFPIMNVHKNLKYLDDLLAFTKYDDIKKLIIKYKFEPRPRLSEIFSDLLYKVYSLSSVLRNLNYVTFVPTTRRSKLRRGFDHTEKLTRHFSKISNTEIIRLLKAIDKKPQTELDGKERNLNVIGRYQPYKINFIPEKIMLIDDIVTTGATINECAKVLKILGVKKVYGLVLAYAD